jgi:hypothetical protein
MSQIESIERSGTETGYGNAQSLRRYSIDVPDVRTPAQAAKLRDELKDDIISGKVPAGPDSIGSRWLAELNVKAKSGAGSSDLKSQTNDIKTLLKGTALNMSGTGPLQDMERAVQQEALEKFDKNEAAGFPQNPWDIYNDNIDTWQARLGKPAMIRSLELRRSIGMAPYSQKAPQESILNKFTDLQSKWDAAPPGPEGDSTRASIRETKRTLKRIEAMEKTILEYQVLQQQSRDARNKERGQTGGGGGAPMLGPRR